jgi:hypothetical protein
MRRTVHSVFATVFAAVCACLAAPAGWADQWAPPMTRLVASELGNYGLIIVPDPLKDADADCASVGTLFRLRQDGTQQHIWRARFVNYPMGVRIGPKGQVITLDTYAHPGGDHAVVVYGRRGEVMADYALKDLLTPEERRRVPGTMSGPMWLGAPGFGYPDAQVVLTYYAEVPHLVIRPAATRGRAIRINLETGKLKRQGNYVNL